SIVAIGAPIAPALSAPSTGTWYSASTVNSIVFSWIDNSSNETGFSIQVDNNADFSSPEYSYSTAANRTTYTALGLSDAVCNYWRVGAFNAVDASWSSAWSFQVDTTAAWAEYITISGADYVCGTTIQSYWVNSVTKPFYVTWKAVDNFSIQADKVAFGGRQYLIANSTGVAWINQPNTFIPGAIPTGWTLNTTADGGEAAESGSSRICWFTFSGKSTAESYPLNIRGRIFDAVGNDSGLISDGVTRYVRADYTSPSMPVPSSPATGGTVSLYSAVSLQWNAATDAGSGISGYSLLVDDDPGFASPLVNQSVPGASWSSATAWALGNYFWRVQATDNVGIPSGWTSAWSFAVDLIDTPVGHASQGLSYVIFTWLDSYADEDGFVLKNGADSQIAVVAANTTTYSAGGLAENSRFTLKIRAYNLAGTSAPLWGMAFTSISSPTGMTFYAATGTTITLGYQGSLANLGLKSSAVEYTNKVALESSGWRTGGWNHGGLVPNTSYTYEVRARNGDGDATGWTSNNSCYTTLGGMPGGVVVEYDNGGNQGIFTAGGTGVSAAATDIQLRKNIGT
ncbi:MAG: hypothetical protein V2A34_09835, partial [Lentisphaerota bacterium]